MNKVVISLVSAFIAFAVSASTTWTLQGETYTVDTLYHAKVGPGTTQTSLALSGSLKLRLFYTTTDLSNPNVDMRVAKAGNVIKKTATVTNLSKTNSKEGSQYFVGVNADFFDMSNGQPLGTNVLNSEVYNLPGNANWTEISFDASKTPRIGDLKFSGSVKKADGNFYEVSTINSGRLENYLVIFSEKFGSSTGANQWGIEVVAKPVEANATIALGKSVKMKIVGSPATEGNMAIPSGGYVLSGHGAAKTFLETLTDGDEIEVSLSATNSNGEPINPVWAVGGCPILLKDGIVQDTEKAEIISHLPSKEPRTAVGYDATGTKVVMMIVDGRSDISDGCRTKILADIMREAGCSDAMNFDGGGSTEMYHQKLGIRNVPSGGVERAVTNGLFAVATSPTDNEIAEIRFVDWVKELPKYGYYTPKFYGYNKYGVLIDTDLKGVILSCSTELGEILENGTKLFGTGGGTHALTATYNGISTTLAVTVDNIADPIFRHPKILLDTFTDYKVDVYGVIRGEDVSLDNAAFIWSSSDESVATVDEHGVIKAQKDGRTVVTGTVGDFSKSVEVVVEVPTKHYQSIDSNLDVSTWTLEVNNLSNASVSNIAGDGFAVDYTTTSTRKLYITLAKDLVSWSRPDSLKIDLNPGTANIKTFYVYAEDYRNPGVQIEYSFDPDLIAGVANRVLIPLSEILDVKDMSSYPLVFKRFYLVLADAKDSTHHMEFGDICWVYNNVPAGGSGIEGVIGNSENSVILSPNPVQAGEVVKIIVPGSKGYIVNTMNGVEVKQGTGTEINTFGLSSGLYIVTIKYGDGIKTAKLIIK